MNITLFKYYQNGGECYLLNLSNTIETFIARLYLVLYQLWVDYVNIWKVPCTQIK